MIKRIGGRDYKYSRMIRTAGGKPTLKYEHPVESKQIHIMEHLSVKDAGIIERAFRRGVKVSTIQDHVWHASGVHVAAQTIYAYMRRHTIKREKREKRIDTGSTKINLTMSERGAVVRAWNQGASWQDIQKKILKASGKRVGRSAIYAYMRLWGNAAKRKDAIKKRG